ncbi:hypothetical protein [Bradyrhizobium prioriisuperbiae]|uniref:terminase small subunit-like protein n=1 Tax=Bradyrhizobium prioriisuperbiae TaxID=2854389 RepID=UPI0028E9AF2F|nr:hypothetical protein [Bradyrhizobium prioritasuperba]
MAGRVSVYTGEIADRIIEQVKQGRSLAQVCRDPGMPNESTVRAWAQANRDGFGSRYRSVARPSGHPSSYTDELAERICTELRTGRTLVDVCRDEGMPSEHTVLERVQRNRGGFTERYRLAREIGYLVMADQIIEIIDDSSNDWSEQVDASGDVRQVFNRENVTRSRLRFEGRRWLLSKALPRIFGERLQLQPIAEPSDSWKELLKQVDGRSRGLPKPPESS